MTEDLFCLIMLCGWVHGWCRVFLFVMPFFFFRFFCFWPLLSACFFVGRAAWKLLECFLIFVAFVCSYFSKSLVTRSVFSYDWYTLASGQMVNRQLI